MISLYWDLKWNFGRASSYWLVQGVSTRGRQTFNLRPGSDAELFMSRTLCIELSTWKVRRLNQLATPFYWAACAPSHKMGFRSSAAKNGFPGEGRHEGLVPRNHVVTNGFIWFSLARTLARILFVPRLRSPWKTHKALRTWRGLFALFEAIRSWEWLYNFFIVRV